MERFMQKGNHWYVAVITAILFAMLAIHSQQHYYSPATYGYTAAAKQAAVMADPYGREKHHHMTKSEKAQAYAALFARGN